MLCERCKIREANIQYTEIVNGVKKEHNFCAQCAKELDFGPYSAIFDSDFPLGKLLSGLLGVGDVHEREDTHQVVCPTCKTSYEEFVKDSRFGCPDCYGVFDLLISDNIKQLQGSDTHKGKRPKYDPDGTSGGSGAGDASGGPGSEAYGSSAAGSTASGRAESGGAGAAGQGGMGFVGAEPDAAEQIRILNARLQEAIKREEYEAAARYRDMIKELREEIGEC